MCRQDNRDQGGFRNTIEAISITSTTTANEAVREIVKKITRVETIQHAIAAEYVFSQEGRLSTYWAQNVEETCQVINHALSTGAEVLGLLVIDATGGFLSATFGVAEKPCGQALQDVLAFKDAFLAHHVNAASGHFPGDRSLKGD